MIPVLETPRLLLRPFCAADAEDVYTYASNPDVGIHAGWPAHGSLKESQQIVQKFIEAGDVWAMVNKETGQVAGSFGLHTDTRRTNEHARMIGYVLAKELWGRGLVAEAGQAVLAYAFLQCNLELVSTYRYAYNIRSGRVMEKLGFIQEGILRQAVQRFDGAVLDSVCYSLTRQEYDALHPGMQKNPTQPE